MKSLHQFRCKNDPYKLSVINGSALSPQGLEDFSFPAPARHREPLRRGGRVSAES
jgi:hypothetical protein